jgi:hypothetical protein
MPAVPSPPAGATTIVLNWHWACVDPPPTLDVAGATICVSCNIAISVRVGSPGNTGDLAQTIAAQTAATATGVAHTIQTALQAAPPAAAALPTSVLPPAPPSVIPPVPPAVTPPAAGPAFVAAAALPALLPALHPYPIDGGILLTPFDDVSTEDAPLHGAPSSFGASTSQARQDTAHGVAGRFTPLVAVPVSSGLLSPQRSTAGRTGAGSRSPAGARRPARGPAAPGAPPSAPAPFVLAAGAPLTHGGGPGVVVAIASALSLAFLYAVYSALRTPSAVPPAGGNGAKPHPPG